MENNSDVSLEIILLNHLFQEWQKNYGWTRNNEEKVGAKTTADFVKDVTHEYLIEQKFHPTTPRFSYDDRGFDMAVKYADENGITSWYLANDIQGSSKVIVFANLIDHLVNTLKGKIKNAL